MSRKNNLTFYLSKEKNYFSHVRDDIIDLIPNNPYNRILEIGCGSGETLYLLKRKNKANYVAGIDIISLEQYKLLDKFICCDIEEKVANLPFPENFFDIIICADVLEHLIDPWKVVKELKKYLKPSGYFIASIPNIREVKTMISIFLKGDFKYTQEGILDITHLRFFCKKNIEELFLGADYKIRKITYKLPPKRNLLNKLTFGFLEEFLVINYLVVAQK